MGSRISIDRPEFHFPCLIDGEVVDREERLLVRYPYTGEVIGSVPRLSEGDAVRAIESAAAGAPRLSRHERSQILLRAAARIEADAAAVARLITWESGLCRKDTDHEVRRALDVLRFAAYTTS